VLSVKMEKDAKLVKENPKFAMKVKGEDFEERPEAGESLVALSTCR